MYFREESARLSRSLEEGKERKEEEALVDRVPF